jgi:hypothetical protein
MPEFKVPAQLGTANPLAAKGIAIAVSMFRREGTARDYPPTLSTVQGPSLVLPGNVIAVTFCCLNERSLST